MYGIYFLILFSKGYSKDAKGQKTKIPGPDLKITKVGGFFSLERYFTGRLSNL